MLLIPMTHTSSRNKRRHMPVLFRTSAILFVVLAGLGASPVGPGLALALSDAGGRLTDGPTSPAKSSRPAKELKDSDADEIPPDATPQIREVKPNQIAAGSEVKIAVQGQNFSSGAYVSCSDPQVHVVSSRRVSPTQLEANLAVRKKAPPGVVTLYVSNPASTVSETSFTILEAAPEPAPPLPPSPSSEPPPPSEKPATAKAHGDQTSPISSAAEQTFSVYNLGEAVSILQSAGQTKATLTVSGGKLKCVEGGKEVFSAALADVKEVDENSIFGVKTGTFHILLNSSKTYNFIASSLQPTDTQAIVAALQAAIK